MALEPWQLARYKDSVDIYREKVDPTTSDSLGYYVVSTGNPCAFHGTPNYDENISAAGQSKTDNIMTANMIEMDIAVDLQSQDLMKVTLRTGGNPFWQQDNGAPQIRTELPRQKVYGIPAIAPVIVSA